MKLRPLCYTRETKHVGGYLRVVERFPGHMRGCPELESELRLPAPSESNVQRFPEEALQSRE